MTSDSNLKILKCYSKAKRTEAPAYSRALQRIKGGFPKGVERSSGPSSKVPGGDSVADGWNGDDERRMKTSENAGRPM